MNTEYISMAHNSGDLDFDVQKLLWEGFLNIEYTNAGHIISTSSDAAKFLGDTKEQVAEVICEFGKESPSKLELPATALFVARELSSGETKKITEGVQKIKGSKYKVEQIEEAINRLKKNQYIAA